MTVHQAGIAGTTMNTLLGQLRHHFHAFRRSQNGNVAVTFAIAVIPIIGFTGAAIDYSRASSVKAAMQAALDATALAMSKEATSVSSSQLQTDAAAYFAAAFNRPDAQSIRISAAYSTSSGSSVTVSGTGFVKTQFMGIMGINTIPVASSSTTAWGMTRLRVALVLDNTGSMADAGKMTALKTATKSLLTQLQNAAANPGDVYVSIVPFVKDVNLDPSNYNAAWIDWTEWDADNGNCNNSGGWGSWGGWGTRSGWGGGRFGTYNSKTDCTSHGGTWNPLPHTTWNGCVVDRGDTNAPNTNNYDTNVVAPTTTITATLFTAEEYDSCPQAVMGLSYNWSAMTTLVNNMSPAGNTNQAIGLALGWMSLAGGGPFSVPAMDSNYQYTQVIILLTDGLNTEDRWYKDQASIDARQAITCNNVKAAKITLYTIQVNTGNDPTSTLLHDCASDASKFFLLTNANQIVSVFNTIGTNLAKLRIAK